MERGALHAGFPRTRANPGWRPSGKGRRRRLAREGRGRAGEGRAGIQMFGVRQAQPRLIKPREGWPRPRR